MTHRENKQNAWYALRRTLPPWRFEENLAELIELCPRYYIDEVIVKVDAEEFSHGLPTLEWVKNYQPCLFRAKEELNKIGVVFSINPWVTLVHNDRGRDCKNVSRDIVFMVGHDGVTCSACACPLSKGWREHTSKLWRIYAETQPEVLWVEDDIRTFGHQPARFGCFCDVHMERFSDRAGERVNRKELVDAILSPGKPHLFRKLWLDLQGEVMVEVAGLLERTVHELSPGTRLGLMSSDPAFHSLEGRKWHEFAMALAGQNNLVSRPPLGIYDEGSLKGLYSGGKYIRQTRYCLPEGITVQTEVENFPYTQYSKSNCFTFLQMTISFAMGSDGVTLNLYDHCGTPMKDNTSIGEMLRDKKPFLNSIVQKCSQKRGFFNGIRILHHDRASEHMVLKEKSDYSNIAQDGYRWLSILESLGFATTFSEADVVAMSGQIIRAFSDDEIKAFLSKGVLIDLSAMRVLIERGFGELLGVSINREFRIHGEEPLSAEEYFNTEFGGAPRTYLTLTLPDLDSNPVGADMSLNREARVISYMVDPDTKRRYPFLSVFENSLGGRVASYPIDINEAGGVAFLNHHRRRQLYYLLKYLSGNKLPLFVEGGVYPLTFRAEYSEKTIVGIFNLSLDSWPNVKVHMHTGGRQVMSIEILDQNGEWITPGNINIQKIDGSILFEIGRPLSLELPMIISVNWLRNQE